MEFFLLCIIGSIAIYSIAIQKTPNPKLSPAKPITPDSSIITFDIHGVLFKADWPKIAKLVWAHKKTGSLIFYIFNPWFIYDLAQMLKKGAVLEKCIDHLSGRHPYFAKHKNFILLIANTQKPIPPMLELVKTLKSHGYTLHIFSNIGTILYKDLSYQFPMPFSLFDDAYTPDGFASKAHPEAFTHYLERYNPHNKQVIFIDNNKNNIALASSAGIVSIYYKKPQQLQAILVKLGVL